MANIIADPTTAGKIYEFVGYGSKSVEKYMYAVYLSLSLSPPLPPSLPPSLSPHRPKAYPLPELVQYMYQVMYRKCDIYTPPNWLFRFVAFMLEQNPFIPYMTRDILTRVSPVIILILVRLVIKI